MLKQLVKGNEASLLGNELVDAHCHLDMFSDPLVVQKDAQFGGVGLIITAGGSRASSLAAIKVSDGERVFAVIGIDPQGIAKDSDFVEEIEKLVKSDRKIVGIGEIGLDYKVGPEKELQKKVFEKQIEIAKSLDIPIVVHSRGAMDDVIRIVKDHGVRKAMFHFFEGSEAQAKELAALGYLISIPPEESSRRKRVINALGINSISVETDSPVVGKSPLDVIKVIEWISAIKGVPFGEASMRITENVKKLFSL